MQLSSHFTETKSLLSKMKRVRFFSRGRLEPRRFRPRAIHRKAKADLPAMLAGSLSEFVRLRAAAGSSRVSVEPVLPPDVIGLFVLMPNTI